MVSLDKAAKQASVDIAGFNDMSIEDVARECHLSLLRAQLAKMREYEEPFRFVVEDASARIRLLKALRAARLRCTTVGRYDHAGAPVDARSAVELLSRVLRGACERPMTVGFSTDHHGVLRAVDIPILVTARPADIVGRASWITQMLRDIACTRRASAPGARSA